MQNDLRNWRACLGKEPLCNHRPDRGLYIGGFCLPLCARCTGILAGAVAAALLRRVLSIETSSIGVLALGLLLIAPTGIDGIIEYQFGIESNNPRRLITGTLAGIGCVITEMALVGMMG